MGDTSMSNSRLSLAEKNLHFTDGGVNPTDLVYLVRIIKNVLDMVHVVSDEIYDGIGETSDTMTMQQMVQFIFHWQKKFQENDG